MQSKKLPVVDFIVAEIFKESIWYLSETEAFLMIHDEGYDWYTVQHYTSNFVVTHGDTDYDLLIHFLRLDPGDRHNYTMVSVSGD